MKTTTLLLTALLTLAASSALAQGQGPGDTCSNQYGACMDRCVSRPQSLQESCAQMCEATTNRCYQGVYGTSAQSSAAPGPAASAEARDARDEAAPDDKPAPVEKPRAKRK